MDGAMINIKMKYFKRWNFDKKMKLFISFSIILCAMTILIISTVSAAISITEKSTNLAKKR